MSEKINNTSHDDVIKWKHFRVTGPLCGKFTGHRCIPITKASDAELWCFLWSAPEQKVNNRDTGDLRRHCAYYDITVMMKSRWLYMAGILQYQSDWLFEKKIANVVSNISCWNRKSIYDTLDSVWSIECIRVAYNHKICRFIKEPQQEISTGKITKIPSMYIWSYIESITMTS